jgi:hypothetical protein
MRQRALPPVVMVTERAIAPGRFLKFDQPHRLLVALRPEKVQDCLQQADKALAQGYHVAGYLSYEAALGLDQAFETSRDYLMPLLWLGVFSAPTCTDGPEPHALSRRLQWQGEFTPEEYRAAIGSIRSEIAGGSTIRLISRFAFGRPMREIRGSCSVTFSTISPPPVACTSTPVGGRFVPHHRNSFSHWTAQP